VIERVTIAKKNQIVRLKCFRYKAGDKKQR
jgi:hypothetical protein